MNHVSARSGFTLIELLVIIAIIGVFSTGIMVVLGSTRDGAKSARAARDLAAINRAMLTMNNDTFLYPNNLDYLCEPLDEISSTNEFAISDPDAGFLSNGRSWSGWNGPYLSATPTDPWGGEYYFDDDYQCLSSTQGCNGFDDPGNSLDTGVIVSCGPNQAISSGSCSYDSDNIVQVLCRRS